MEGVSWMKMPQDRDRGQMVMNVVMNL